MDQEQGGTGVERRFVMVVHRFNPRKIVRGTATEIIGATLFSEDHGRRPPFLRSESAFEEFNFPTNMPSIAARYDRFYPIEPTVFDLIEAAEDRIHWLKEHAGLDIESDEDHLRAIVALVGAGVDLHPEPDFWEVPDRCGWIEERKLMVGPRPDLRPGSERDTSLKALLDFGVTAFVDASPEPDIQLPIVASLVEAQLPLRLLTLKRPDRVVAAGGELTTLADQDEVVYLFPGQDPGFFLDLLLHYLGRRGEATRDSLARVFTRVPRGVFLSG